MKKQDDVCIQERQRLAEEKQRQDADKRYREAQLMTQKAIDKHNQSYHKPSTVVATSSQVGGVVSSTPGIWHLHNTTLSVSLRFNDHFQVDLGFPVPECLHSGLIAAKGDCLLSVMIYGSNPGWDTVLCQTNPGTYAIGLISWAVNCHQAV